GAAVDGERQDRAHGDERQAYACLHGGCPSSGRSWGTAGGRVEQAAAGGGQRAAQQPGHVHLGDAEGGADLGLGQVPVEAHGEDLLLALGELVPVGGHRLHVDRALDVGVLVAEHVGQLPGVVPVRQRRVEGVGGEHHVRLLGLEQILG